MQYNYNMQIGHKRMLDKTYNMNKFNYRTTVNINQKIMKLGFRGMLPEEMQGYKIRIQAIFTQRQTDRRFPMDVTIEETELGLQIEGNAEIDLPYVFYYPPKHRINVIFAIWWGTNEMILDSQPFPVEKEMFFRADSGINKSRLKFALATAALPVLLAKNYFDEEQNMEKAKKIVNERIYRATGYNYSPRQQNTDYFAAKYEQFVEQIPELTGNRVLFLSEREPESGGNLMLVKEYFEQDPSVQVTEFICTRTVDQLKKKELSECARKCAQARVIILEDFYPQLHKLNIRRETKVVQLWHACGAFKTFGFSRLGKVGGAPQNSMNHRNYDFVSVSGDRISDLYAEAFALSASKVKALGVPRTDILFDWEYKKKKREMLYEKYPQIRDSKVILFAPTFRGDGNKDAYYPKEAFDVNEFIEAMPEDTICILKNHPFVKEPMEVNDIWKEQVLDLTGKDSINDLMLVTDLLITDYSSSVFEASILELPMLFYAFDQEEYMRDRDFYFDYNTFAPGPIEHSFEAMTEHAVRMITGESEPEVSYDKFREVFLNALDGHSTEKICGYIKDNYLKEGSTGYRRVGRSGRTGRNRRSVREE